ncbi:hypothetical protein FOA52_005841 [Chlamydomonas sp. UWO 241]|nr:hypothetical protein FOA52_005841 [Chlamydomonas sp. UWO 241]
MPIAVLLWANHRLRRASTFGHIHNGTKGQAGPVVVMLFSFTDPVNGGLQQYISGSFSTSVMLDLNAFPGLIEMVTSGSAYVNVHSKAGVCTPMMWRLRVLVVVVGGGSTLVCWWGLRTACALIGAVMVL